MFRNVDVIYHTEKNGVKQVKHVHLDRLFRQRVVCHEYSTTNTRAYLYQACLWGGGILVQLLLHRLSRRIPRSFSTSDVRVSKTTMCHSRSMVKIPDRSVPSSPHVFEGQCHLTHPIILSRFSWASLARVFQMSVHRIT